MIKVVFTYDEETRLWDPVVEGAATELEARQAFNAVVITAQCLKQRLLRHTKTETTSNGFRIIPAV